MCVILHKPKNTDIPVSRLKQCWKSNPHGAGLMYAHNGVKIVKGLMTFSEFLKAYNKHKDRELIVHFRYKSRGEVLPEQTHPFKVSRNLGVCHNGTIIDDTVPANIGGSFKYDNTGYTSNFRLWEDDKKSFTSEDFKKIDRVLAEDEEDDEDDDIEVSPSDTQILVDEYLKELPKGFLNNSAITSLLEEHVKGSVLVFMNGKSNISILGYYDKSEFIDGVWYSNTHWRS